MKALSGPELFCRFAFPPNSLGYCGPDDTGLIPELMTAGAMGEIRQVIPAFDGAWPYLELIAACSRRDPLDREVIEAYWLGGPLLDRVDLLTMGNSVEERFRGRAGWDWGFVAEALNTGARPTHSFHVFCVYPWVGLLRSGSVDQALVVLDRCRIRWGRVEAVASDRIMLRFRPLAWDGRTLSLGREQIESVLPPEGGDHLAEGDLVAAHWDYICSPISPRQQRYLARYQRQHMSIANASNLRLET